MAWLTAVRIAARMLARRRTFTIAATLTLAIGISGFAVVFSVVSRVLLRPLPYPAADRLVSVYQVMPDLRQQLPQLWNSFGFSFEAFRAIQADVPAFDLVAAFARASKVVALHPGAPLERVDVQRVSATAFPLLGIRPALGRTLLESEDAPPGAPLAMISHEVWQREFGAAEDVLSRAITIDRRLHQIVGVLPRDFALPGRITPGIWIPIGSDPDDVLPRKTPLSLVGRLAGDSALAATQIARVLASLQPGTSLDARVAPWQLEVTRASRRPILFLLVSAIALLAMAGVSAGGLMLLDLRARFGEFAARVALGARRSDLFTQLTIEGALIAVMSVVAGVGLAWMTLPWIRTAGTAGLPALARAGIDPEVIAASLAAALGTTLLVACASAVTVIRRSLSHWLSRGRHHESTGNGLILGTQLALATVLLLGAALLTSDVMRTSRVDPGFDSRGRYVLQLDLGAANANSNTAIPALLGIGEQLRKLRAVHSIAIASAVPFSGGNSSGAATVARDTINARFSSVLPGFFETLGLRIVAGRAILESDRPGNELVAVVNETMSRDVIRGDSALGSRVGIGDNQFTVVGVVSDVRHGSLIAETQPTVYLAEQQRHSRFLQIVMRMTCDETSSRCASANLAEIRKAVAQVAPGVVVVSLEGMDRLVTRSFAQDRFRSGITTVFALVAVVLMLVGVYSTTARAIQHARRDVAIRLALGATTVSTIGHFTRRFALLATVGVSIGAALATLGAGAIEPFLAHTSATDRIIFAAVALGTIVAATTTAAFATRSISRIDPGVVLKGGA